MDGTVIHKILAPDLQLHLWGKTLCLRKNAKFIP